MDFCSINSDWQCSSLGLRIISCPLREIEFSLPSCIPPGSLKAILCVWHLNVGAFVVICPVTSAGENPGTHLHKTYLTWASRQQNFSQAACIAQLEVGCLTVTSFAGCYMLTKVHTVRPSLKKTFFSENLFTFIIIGGVAKPANFPSESHLCQYFMRCLFIVNNCRRPCWEPSSTNLMQHRWTN